MIVLDLGCGVGKPLTFYQVNGNDWVIGIDMMLHRLRDAAASYPHRSYVLARGERIPLADGTADRVVSSVAIPYMRLPRALKEVHRVLRSGGTFMASLHNWRFTMHELRHNAFPRPKATLYRCGVLVSGIGLHLTGRTWLESFQTRKGMTRALRLSGFRQISFQDREGRWVVTATK